MVVNTTDTGACQVQNFKSVNQSFVQGYHLGAALWGIRLGETVEL